MDEKKDSQVVDEKKLIYSFLNNCFAQNLKVIANKITFSS